MATHPNYRATPFDGSVENTEFEFHGLYLHHIYGPPSPNQSTIIRADATTGWGTTAANNWTIYDAVGPNAKLVARAQGLHLYAGSWHNTFTIVFEIEGFKESTLQVMGTSVDQEGEWSIVGGTGELAMARGVVNKKLHGKTDGGNIIELTIHGFCRRKHILTKSGPWGGNGGSVFDITEKPMKLESITILHDGVIATFQYSYIDQNGKKHTAGPWGSSNQYRAEIVLVPGEIVTEVSGKIINHGNRDCIQTLKITTNKKTYGPYGNSQNRAGGTPFSAVAPNGKSIVGFFGRTDNIDILAIGVYVA